MKIISILLIQIDSHLLCICFSLRYFLHVSNYILPVVCMMKTTFGGNGLNIGNMDVQFWHMYSQGNLNNS